MRTKLSKSIYHADMNTQAPLRQGEYFDEPPVNISLHGTTSEQMQCYARTLASWAQAKHPELSFLDITYFDTTRQTSRFAKVKGSPFSIVIAPADNVQSYTRVLRELISSGTFLLGSHPVFVEGLPVFKFTDGNTMLPATTGELRKAREGGAMIVDSSYLISTIDPQPVIQSTLEGDALDFQFSFVTTNDYDAMDLPRAVTLQARCDLNEMWKRFARALCESPNKFESGNRLPLSTLVAMPIGVQTAVDQFLGLANVYLGVDAECSPETLKRLLGTLKAHVLANNSYSVGQSEGDRLGQKKAAGNWGHEVKKVSRLLTADWLPTLGDMFELVEWDTNLPAIAPEKVGRASFLPEFLHLAWGVTPFRNEITSAGGLMNLWCGNVTAEDYPLPSCPETIDALIRDCWHSAVAAVSVYAMTGTTASDAGSVSQRLKQLDAFRSLFPSDPIVRLVNGCSFPPIAWQDYADIDEALWLCRLLLSLFTNVACHGDLSQEPTVAIAATQDSSGRKGEYLLEVSNALAPKLKVDIVASLQNAHGHAHRNAPKFNNLDNIVDLWITGKEKMQSTFEVRHKQVVDLCVEKLKGERLPPNRDEPLKWREQFHILFGACRNS
jgi:hypothetical protein